MRFSLLFLLTICIVNANENGPRDRTVRSFLDCHFPEWQSEATVCHSTTIRPTSPIRKDTTTTPMTTGSSTTSEITESTAVVTPTVAAATTVRPTDATSTGSDNRLRSAANTSNSTHSGNATESTDADETIQHLFSSANSSVTYRIFARFAVKVIQEPSEENREMREALSAAILTLGDPTFRSVNIIYLATAIGLNIISVLALIWPFVSRIIQDAFDVFEDLMPVGRETWIRSILTGNRRAMNAIVRPDAIARDDRYPESAPSEYNASYCYRFYCFGMMVTRNEADNRTETHAVFIRMGEVYGDAVCAIRTEMTMHTLGGAGDGIFYERSGDKFKSTSDDEEKQALATALVYKTAVLGSAPCCATLSPLYPVDHRKFTGDHIVFKPFGFAIVTRAGMTISSAAYECCRLRQGIDMVAREIIEFDERRKIEKKQLKTGKKQIKEANKSADPTSAAVKREATESAKRAVKPSQIVIRIENGASTVVVDPDKEMTE